MYIIMKKVSINSNIKYDEFKDTHSNKKVIRHKMRGIKSKNCNITT